MCLFLDANVIFATAISSDGRCSALFQLSSQRCCTLLMEIGLPLKDAPILTTAVENWADLLVTGDKTHFGSLYSQVLKGVEVVNPRAAIARLLNQENLRNAISLLKFHNPPNSALLVARSPVVT